MKKKFSIADLCAIIFHHYTKEIIDTADNFVVYDYEYLEGLGIENKTILNEINQNRLVELR